MVVALADRIAKAEKILTAMLIDLGIDPEEADRMRREEEKREGVMLARLEATRLIRSAQLRKIAREAGERVNDEAHS